MKNLRKRIVQNGLKYSEFAEMLGVSRAVVSNWARERNEVPAKYIDKINSILGEEKEYGDGKQKIIDFISKTVPNDFTASHISMTFDSDGSAIIKIT